MITRAILIVAATAAVTGVATAATGATSMRSRSRLSVLTLLAPTGGTTTPIDLGAKGMSPGDEFVTTDSPLDRPHRHARIGRFDGIETALSRARSSLAFTAQLPGGTLQVEGVFNPNNLQFTLPIVGGTGAYLGAHGAATLNTRASTPTITFRWLGH